MPIYEFLCHKCEKSFELTYSLAEYEREKKKIKCPKCESTSVVRQISAWKLRLRRKAETEQQNWWQDR